MTIDLTAAQSASWADAQWRAGFLAGLQAAFSRSPDVQTVTIRDAGGTTLLTAARVWQLV